MSYTESLEINTLVGRKVTGARVNDEKDLVVLDTDKGTLYLTWEGSCCAKCYIAHVSGVDALVGATITEAVNAEWKDVQRNEDDYEVVENMGTNIKTDKGHVTFESRVEHNGYYGGEIMISDKYPLDQYHSARYVLDYSKTPMPELKPLVDF